MDLPLAAYLQVMVYPRLELSRIKALRDFTPCKVNDIVTSLSCPICWKEGVASYMKGSASISCSNCHTKTTLLDLLTSDGSSELKVASFLSRAVGYPAYYDLITSKGVSLQALKSAAVKNGVEELLLSLRLPKNTPLGYVSENELALSKKRLNALKNHWVIPWFYLGPFQLVGYELVKGSLYLRHEPFWYSPDIPLCHSGHPKNKYSRSLSVVTDPLLATLLINEGVNAVALGYLTQIQCIRYLAKTDNLALQVILGPDEHAVWERFCENEIVASVRYVETPTNALANPLNYPELLHELTGRDLTTTPPKNGRAQTTLADVFYLIAQHLNDGVQLDEALELACNQTDYSIRVFEKMK